MYEIIYLILYYFKDFFSYFEESLSFIFNFVLVMIPLILSIDTLQEHGEYSEVHHSTRVKMLNTAQKLIVDTLIVFVIKTLLQIEVLKVLEILLRIIELIIIFKIFKKVMILFRYLLDEIKRFENFK